jgi:hypothetical protein
MVPTSSGTTRRTQDTTKPIVDELKRANTHLRDIKNKPTAEIEDADL